MRHGVLNGGKRLRPFLVMESAALFDADAGDALRVAAALECVHCYSLIHDDLPAMDDDDLRRGQPTVHRAFDEATAILAGDSLLTLAFDIMASTRARRCPRRRGSSSSPAWRAPPGSAAWPAARRSTSPPEATPPDETGIITLQAMKTGALIRYRLRGGRDRRRASPADRERLGEFGAAIGLAFQLADDLLDLSADAGAMGKATGKDAAAGKATLVALHGEDWARRQLAGLVDQAQALLEPFGERARLLNAAAAFVATRATR